MTTDGVRLAWTPLSRRLGITRTAGQRQALLDAVPRMDWTADIDGQLRHINGEAARAIAAAVSRNRGELRLLGIGALPDGRQLVGLQHDDGTRTYLLALQTDGIALAVHVMTEAARATDNRVA